MQQLGILTLIPINMRRLPFQIASSKLKYRFGMFIQPANGIHCITGWDSGKLCEVTLPCYPQPLWLKRSSPSDSFSLGAQAHHQNTQCLPQRSRNT